LISCPPLACTLALPLVKALEIDQFHNFGTSSILASL
jgi:hypothetical protein